MNVFLTRKSQTVIVLYLSKVELPGEGLTKVMSLVVVLVEGVVGMLVVGVGVMVDGRLVVPKGLGRAGERLEEGLGRLLGLLGERCRGIKRGLGRGGGGTCGTCESPKAVNLGPSRSWGLNHRGLSRRGEPRKGVGAERGPRSVVAALGIERNGGVHE